LIQGILRGLGILGLLFGLLLSGGIQAFSVQAAEPASQNKADTLEEIKVEIFGTSWCPYCRQAKKFFNDRGIPVVEYDIEKNREAAEVKNRLDRRRGVPFVLINRKYGYHGFSPEVYEQMLERARNPESS